MKIFNTSGTPDVTDKWSEPRENSNVYGGSSEQMTALEEFTCILGVLRDTIDPDGRNNYLQHESFYAQLNVFTELSRVVNSYENLNVLELGCGSGLLSIALAQIGCSVTSSNFYGSTEQNIQDLLNESGFNHSVRFIQQNLEEDTYKFEKNYYDVVFAVDVLEHVKNVKSLFLNTYNCLKPNGLLIVYTPNYARLNVRIKAIKNIFNPIWPIYFERYVKDNPYMGHIREFTPRELIELYKLFNFEVLVQHFPKIMSFDRLPYHPNKVLQIPIRLSWQLEEIVRQFFPKLGHSQLVVGRKK